MAYGAEDRFVGRYQNRAQACREFGELADRYASFYKRGDPVADALVDWLSAHGEEGTRLLERALRQLTAHELPADWPEPLRAFLDDACTIPDWVDFDEINLGAAAYQRLGLMAMIILSAWSLVNGYHSSAAVKPLAFTGELTKRAPGRLIETAGFVSEAVQTDGLRRGNAGYEMTVRVRIVHAQVRRACARSERWRKDEWGTPINQADMFGTLLEFSLLVVEGARRLGFRMSRREREAILTLWRYAGHLSGVHPALLDELSSEERASHIRNLVGLVQPGPDEDSIELTQALLRVLAMHRGGRAEAAFAAVVSRYHSGLSRALNGKEVSDALGVPDDIWQYAIYPTWAIVRPLEAVRRRIPGASRLLSLVGNQTIRQDLKRKVKTTRGLTIA